MASKPFLHFLCFLLTKVLGILHSGGDVGLKGGQMMVLEVKLGHSFVREDVDRVIWPWNIKEKA